MRLPNFTPISDRRYFELAIPDCGASETHHSLSSAFSLMNRESKALLVTRSIGIDSAMRFDLLRTEVTEEVTYLITLSARDSTLGGIVRPICLAAFRLITNSKFVGCSTGSSEGLAPFTILSI
jgi:hypothetical protein